MPIQTPQSAPINNETPTTNTTLRDAVATRIAQTLEMDGIEAAKKELNTLATMFSFVLDWPIIFKEAMEYLLEQKRQMEQTEEERRERKESAWINALAQHGINGQFNMLPGKDAQAPYYSTPMGGDKQ